MCEPTSTPVDQPPTALGTLAVDGTRQMRPRSLAVRLVIFAMLLVVVAMGVTSRLGYVALRDLLQGEVQARLTLAASDRRMQLAAYSTQQRGRLAQIANRIRLRELLDRPAAGATAEFTESLTQVLRDEVEGTSDLRVLVIAAPDGKVIAATDSTLVGESLAADPDFQLGRMRVHIAAPRQSAVGVRIKLAGPIGSAAGPMRSVLLADFDAESLVRILTDVSGLGQTGELLVGRRQEGRLSFLIPPRTGSRPAAPADEFSTLDRAAAGESGFHAATFGGVAVVAAFMPVEYDPGVQPGWGLVAKIDEAEAFAALDRWVRRLWVGMAAVAVAGLIVTGVAAQRLQHRWQKLLASAARVAHNAPANIGATTAAEPVAAGMATSDPADSRSATGVAMLSGRQTMISEPILESIADGIVVADEQGRFVVFNSAAARMLGRGATTAAPAAWSEHFHLFLPDETTPFHSENLPLVRALRGETVREAEVVVRLPDRPDVVWLSVNASPLIDESGHSHGAVCIFRDVTEGKRVASALDQEKHLLTTLMEHLPDSIYFKDAESRFVRISRGLANRFGLADPALAVGKSDRDFFTEEHARQARQDEHELMRTGQPVLGKIEKETWPDGHSTWAATSKLPLHDLHGRVVGTFGISRDVTEQKRAEEELQHNVQRTQLIIETANDAFVAMDSTGLIIDWNRAAARVFGWSRDEALGRPVAELIVPPPLREAHRAGIARLLAGEPPRMLNERIEIAAMRRDGTEFPVEITITRLRDDESSTFNAFLHDITQRHRTAEALRQAKELAESASRAKSEFLANMSHEIRTPMNAVIGMTELVLDTQLSSNQREYLTIVRESGEALMAVINDILDFSKIEAGKLDLERMMFDIRESLGDAMKLLAVRAHAKNLELACHIAPDVPNRLLGDAGRLRQIVMNLVGNAIKFTECGEVVLDVSCAERTSDGVGLHLCVSDTGIGIPHHKQADIFKAFEQADSSTTRRFGGTGLGLTISSRLVELMGGRIWLDSEPGRGSVFHFTAWFSLPADADIELYTPSRVMIAGLRVLIVDDNATNRRILEEMLGNWGMAPTSVAGGAAALESVRKARIAGAPFQLILTDAHMPDMNGFTFAEHLGQDGELQGAVVMMLTSGGASGDVARCESLGISAYLLKPIKQSDLFDAIVSVVDKALAREHAPLSLPRAADPVAWVALTRPLRVLLAEDSLVNQKLAVGLLSKWGHTVRVADNGCAAVAAFHAEPFDLILMDVQMPEMDGFEATAAIRNAERATNRRTPIIAMTAHAMKGDRERCLEAGMDGYVSKPVQAQKLSEAIASLCAPSEIAATVGAGDATLSVAPPPAFLPIDEAELLSRFNGDQNLLRELIAVYLEVSPGLLRDLNEAVSRRNSQAVERAAHLLKGTVANFAAEAVADLALKLECMGRNGDWGQVDETRAALETAVVQLAAALKAFDREE